MVTWGQSTAHSQKSMEVSSTSSRIGSAHSFFYSLFSGATNLYSHH